MIPTEQSRRRTTSDRNWLPMAVLVWAFAAAMAWSIFSQQRDEAPSDAFVLRLHVDDDCTLTDSALETVRSGLDTYGERMWVETLIDAERELAPEEAELIDALRALPRTQIERVKQSTRMRESGERCWERIGT